MIRTDELYAHLENDYKKGEPVYVSELRKEMGGVSRDEIKEALKILCRKGRVRKYSEEIYGVTWDSVFGEVYLGDESILYSLFIKRRDTVFGYYTGPDGSNLLGFSAQVPMYNTVASNNTSSNTTIRFGNRMWYLETPVTTVTKENHRILQILDAVRDIDKYRDGSKNSAMRTLKEDMEILGIASADLLKYARYYPEYVREDLITFKLTEE